MDFVIIVLSTPVLWWSSYFEVVSKRPLTFTSRLVKTPTKLSLVISWFETTNFIRYRYTGMYNFHFLRRRQRGFKITILNKGKNIKIFRCNYVNPARFHNE